MRNLFIIQSPFQLISAIEGANYFSGDENTLIICYTTEERNNEQIRMALEYYPHWSEVIELFPTGLPLWPSLQLLLEARKRGKSGYQPERVFIGEYRSQYMVLLLRIMKPRECFLLDDGSITIGIQEEYLKGNRPYVTPGIKGWIVKWVLPVLFRVDRREQLVIHLFTCFDLQPISERQRVIVHSFEYAKSHAGKKTVDQTAIYFFGGHLSGLDVLSEDRELALIGQVKDYFGKRGFRMIYIPHRREPDRKIQRLQTELGMEVIRFNNAAELEVLSLPTIPYGIASFYSTVLLTLPKLCDFTLVQSFQLPLAEMPECYRPVIELTYLEYGKIMPVTELS